MVKSNWNRNCTIDWLVSNLGQFRITWPYMYRHELHNSGKDLKTNILHGPEMKKFVNISY